MPPAIKIGSRVRCINAANMGATHGEILPVEGRTYTVRDIVVTGAGQCLRLQEIFNTPVEYIGGIRECSFKASRFALVKGRK
jgi:hypothetical protein